MSFNPLHSPLEQNSDSLNSYVDIIEKELGNNIEISGIIEFGSYAKGEAIKNSDVDTRIYVSSPNCYIWQAIISRFNQSQADTLEQHYVRFEEEFGKLPRKEYDWWTFNNSLSEKITELINVNVEFGLVDYRYADFELKHLDSFATTEHAMLLQSNIIYDPNEKISQMRQGIIGKRFTSLVSFYQERYLEKLPFEIYNHIRSDANDDFKVKKSRQIQWVKWAVRCLRDAVASKTYITSRNFTYKKDAVLNFYKQYLPDDYKFIEQIYSWKTDEKTREDMVNDFLADKEKYFKLFEELIPKLEAIVEKVNKLTLHL